NASEDLPEPESPVMTTSWSRGISRSMPLRLCSRAPRTTMRSLAMDATSYPRHWPRQNGGPARAPLREQEQEQAEQRAERGDPEARPVRDALDGDAHQERAHHVAQVEGAGERADRRAALALRHAVDQEREQRRVEE